MASTLEHRKQHWRDLMHGQGNDCILVDIDDIPDPQEGWTGRPEPWPTKVTERLDWSFRNYELMLQRMDRVDDDRIPFLDLFTGTEIFAECFGCPVSRFSDEMPFALPVVHNAAEAALLRPLAWDQTPLVHLMELATKARARFPDAPIRLPDIQSPFDVAALIWDKAEFYPALIEDPKAIQGTTQLAEKLITDFMDAWLSEFGPSFVAHYPLYYMDEGITMSVDEVGVISRQIFDDLVFPELSRLSAHFNGLGIHCCADAAHQWSGFTNVPGLKLLNFMPTLYDASDAFEIIGTKAAQMHQWKDECSWKDRIESIPAEARVVWWWQAPDAATAQQGIEELRLALAAAGRIR